MREPPKGILLFVRRRVLPLSAKLSAALGCVLLAAWLAGRILTDEHHWSQYVYWAPTLWVLGGGAVLWVVSAAAGRFALRVGGAFLRPVLLVGLIAVAGWMLVVEWRLVRLARAAPGDEAIRVLNWNISAKWGIEDAGGAIAIHDPDIIVLKGVPRDHGHAVLLAALAAHVAPVPVAQLSADEQAHEPNPLEALGGDRPIRITNRGNMLVVSRLPILRMGTAYLAPLPERDENWRSQRQGGSVTFFEFDTREHASTLGRAMVVWLVDMPSDPSLHKMRVAERARAAVDGWAGRPLVATPMGALASGELCDFPEPDVVVGDFNTPRGSASVHKLVGAVTDAHAAGGVGPDFSWPMPRAWWGIDQAFVGERWRVLGYDIKHPPAGEHGMQVLDIEPTRTNRYRGN